MSCSPPAIHVTNAWLAYRTMTHQTRSLKELAVKVTRRKTTLRRFWGLRDVSFDVTAGELFAVIGANGAGKSTLMKLLARVLPPTAGRIVVRGRVAPMIELAAGFDPELTTHENVLLHGTLLGHTVQDMRARLNDIVRWAEVDEFIDTPLRAYSSGMLARLGFAVATHAQPDILLVDEVLSVGDEAFQRKSRARIEELLAAGTTILLVSHQLDLVKAIATRAMWLDHGAVRAIGGAVDVVEAYQGSVQTPGP